MRFGVLGSLSVESEGVDLTPARPKERAVLALLLLRAPEVVSVDDLVAAAWGERAPRSVRTALHGLVSALRRRLGAHRIETREGGYVLRLEDDDELDLDQVQRIARAAAAAGTARERSLRLRRALELFRGEPLREFRYVTFASAHSARVEELQISLLEQCVDAELDLGRHGELLPELAGLVARHPLRERLRGQLALALYRTGRQADALRELADARRVLVAELGIEPGPVLRELEQRILNQDPALEGAGLFHAAAAPPADGAPEGLVTFLAARSLAPGTPDIHGILADHGGWTLESPRHTVLVAFARARDAARAAIALLQASGGGALALGIHSAEAFRARDGYSVGGTRTAAACAAAAHPGQTVLTPAARDLLREAGVDERRLPSLGTHRLADLAPPRRLFQLTAPGVAEAEFPPLRGLEHRPTNLPVQTAALVGRERELAELVATLVGGTSLVTLTGAGGSGKTRLALHTAADALDAFPDGVFIVALAPLADPELVIPTVARTLGLAGGDSEEVARYLRDRRVLVVLDNCEHVLAAADRIAALAAPGHRGAILATSRAPLRAPHEHVYPVQPLSVDVAGGEVDELLRTSATALFVARALEARADFTPTVEDAAAIAEICARLDGLPLAIELAAARIAVLSPVALLERLDRSLAIVAGRGDRPPRHRTLTAAIAWSHDQLEPSEQRLFAELAVFAGGWTLEAAEAACTSAVDVIGGLSALVDASLVTVTGGDATPRFSMLETIREYAGARLEESPDRATAFERHAAFYLSLAELAEPHLRGTPGEWLDRLEQEVGNFRAALDRLEAAGERDRFTRLAGALWRFWYLRGYLTEGRQRLEAALAADGQADAPRAKALLGAAVTAINTGDVGGAAVRASEALALYEALGDAWGAAYAQFMLANTLADDPSRAIPLYRSSVETFHRLGDAHSALLATRHLAYRLEQVGAVAAARSLHEENLQRARATKNGRLEASSLGALASIALDAGRVDEALELLRESLAVHHELGDVLDTAEDLYRAAFVLACDGDPGTAARLLASTDAHRDQIGARHDVAARLNEETRRIVCGQLDSDALALAERDGRTLPLREAAALAREALA